MTNEQRLAVLEKQMAEVLARLRPGEKLPDAPPVSVTLAKAAKK